MTGAQSNGSQVNVLSRGGNGPQSGSFHQANPADALSLSPQAQMIMADSEGLGNGDFSGSTSGDGGDGGDGDGGGDGD